MRLLCELVIIGALVWFGWSKSFQSWSNQLRGVPEAKVAIPGSASAPVVASAPRQPFLPRYRPAPTSTPSGDWMWDPAHRSPLDRPAFDAKNPSSTYTNGDKGTYWIDSRGVRHSYNATPAA